MMSTKWLFRFLVLLTVGAVSQNDLKPFQWRDHLPYNSIKSVTSQGNTIYAVANECVFSYNKSDNSFSRFNKVTGLSDVNATLVKNNPYNNTLFIVYENSNIDIIKNGVIYNVSDIKRKQNIGNKTIINITFFGKLAYIACGFGIVVYDTDILEIKDTYVIGSGGSPEKVYEVAINNGTIYAATQNGLKSAPLNSPNLSNFQNWSIVGGLPSGPYNTVTTLNGKVYTNWSRLIQSNNTVVYQDTIYEFNGTAWSKYLPKWNYYSISKLAGYEQLNQLVIIDQWGFEAFDQNGNRLITLWDLTPFAPDYKFNDVMPDPSDAGWYWGAFLSSGLIKFTGIPGDVKVGSYSKYEINGPLFSMAGSMAIKDKRVIVAPSNIGDGVFNNYTTCGPYSFSEGVWKNLRARVNPPLIFDINSVCFDKNDNTHFFAASLNNGICEYLNDSLINQFTCQNTPVIGCASTFSVTNVTGLATDEDNNLYCAISENSKLLAVRKNDGTWISLNFGFVAGSGPKTGKVMVDKNNQVWVIAKSTGMFVYRNGGNFPNPNSSNTKKLTTTVNNGGLPSLELYCMAEDKEGDIWVGTDKGVTVFYNPENIFSSTSGWDAQQIFITQDDKTQILLETEIVTSIAVDGANNKWIGTRYNGLYCFSPNGQKLLYHFTFNNSPLFSNSIIDVKVDSKTGEVFIISERGMQSFQNVVIDGFEHFEDVYAYPNPVKPGFDGPVLIHGMISGSNVKIVDVAGNLVYETTSKGGQASWNAKNFRGERVASGVYLVLCATPAGEEKTITKILVLN